jgi:ribonuclease VapC
MFVDASAMVAILVEGGDAAALTRRLEQAAERCTSPIAIWEAVAAVARVSNVPIRAAETILDRFLEQATVHVVPITVAVGRSALSGSSGMAGGGTPPHSIWATVLRMRAPGSWTCPFSSRATTSR